MPEQRKGEGEATGLQGQEIRAARPRLRPLSVCLIGIGLLVALVPLAMAKGWFVPAEGSMTVFGVSCALSLLAFLFSQVDSLKWTVDPGTLLVAERTLAFEGRMLVRPGAFRDAVAYTNGGFRHGVRARTRFRTFYFDVESRAAADSIVSALGLDSRRAIIGFRPAVVLASTVGALGMLALSRWAPVLAVTSATTLLQVVYRGLVSPRCVVGADGLLIEKWFGLSKRFLPYAEVARVDVEGATLAITLHDWTRLVLKSEDDSRRTAFPVVGAHALKARIEQARASYGEGSRASEVAADLARGGRDTATWLDALRRLGVAHATFRRAAVPRDRLWTALEDGGQPAEVRAAAAIALRPALAEAEKVRFASIAASCAAPRLRVALEAVEGEDEEQIASALDELARERMAMARR